MFSPPLRFFLSRGLGHSSAEEELVDIKTFIERFTLQG